MLLHQGDIQIVKKKEKKKKIGWTSILHLYPMILFVYLFYLYIIYQWPKNPI